MRGRPARPAIRRDGAVRQDRAMRKTMQRLAETPGERSRSPLDEDSAAEAGGTDPTSGDYRNFGLMDLTPLGEFYLS